MATHSAGLRRLCRAYEVDPQRREELEQDILLQAWRAFSQIEQADSPKAFLFRVAHNTALKHVRFETRRPRGEELPELAEAPVAERELSRRRLYAAVRALPALDRQLVLLHLEGFTHAEIADVTGMSVSNVGTRLQRLRRRIQDQLGGSP